VVHDDVRLPDHLGLRQPPPRCGDHHLGVEFSEPRHRHRDQVVVAEHRSERDVDQLLVRFGGGVIVCPGVTIGNNTVVDVGSVVTGDLPDHVLAVGNPARVVRKI
jgi:hypothetical protein